MTRLRRIFSLMLVLLLCLEPLHASAQSAAVDTDQYNMITFTSNSITIDDPSLPIDNLPLSLSLTFGTDGTTFDTLRTLISMSVGFDGENLIDAAAALENNEVKLHIAGMSQDIAIPMNQALESLLSNTFLGGEPLSEAPIEFMEAFGELLTEINSLLAQGPFAQASETPSHYLYSEDDWRSFFVEYPARMRAVPAGEEEITFEGNTYTARKYTYHIDRLSFDEYQQYRDGLIITNEEYRASTAATAGLEAALEKMYEIGAEMQTEKNASEDSAYASEDTAYAEPVYSEDGTFYLIDEVMGTLETGTRTIHYSDGTEYVENIEFISYMTDSQLLMETVSTTSTGSTRDSSSVTAGEDGTFTIVSTSQAVQTMNYGEYSFTYRTDSTATEAISNDSITMSMEGITSYTYSADNVTETDSEIVRMDMQMNVVSDTQAELSTSMSTVYLSGGEESASNFAMDFTIEMGMLSEGTLLRVSGKPFNPLDASDEELTAYGEELSELLINIITSLIPAIETPSSVGGALLG